MCVYSMIADHYIEKWNPLSPQPAIFNPSPTKEEFEVLKNEVLEMKELLKKALDYDKKNNQPDCGKQDKIEIIKKVAELVGVDLTDLGVG